MMFSWWPLEICFGNATPNEFAREHRGPFEWDYKSRNRSENDMERVLKINKVKEEIFGAFVGYVTETAFRAIDTFLLTCFVPSRPNFHRNLQRNLQPPHEWIMNHSQRAYKLNLRVFESCSIFKAST